jgi:hypothetical protein
VNFLSGISGILASVTMLLVARGFVPYLRWRIWDDIAYMRLSIVLLSALSVTRMAWWDVLRPAMGSAMLMKPFRPDILSQSINAGFNLLTLAAAVAALAALHHSIPLRFRNRYNWFTAPFYPPHQPRETDK